MENIFTTMRRTLKNYLIPHEGNDHKPHLLREASVLVLIVIIVVTFGFSVFRGLIINKKSDFTAAVLPAILVDLANTDRQAGGLGELTVSPVLENAARMKAQNMADNGYFAHVSPDGLDPWYWFYRAGYNFVDAGENLAVNFSDSEDVETAWMNSPGHRANIMNGKFTEIGIAAVKGTYKGKNTIFVVQLFGLPAQKQTLQQPFGQTKPTTSAEPIATTSTSSAIVAGASAATLPPAPTPVPQRAPERLIKENLSAHVEGAQIALDTKGLRAPTAPTVAKSKDVSTWETLASHPRAIVSWVYLMIGLLISFVLLCMVYMRVHKEHSRSIIYGVALLSLIVILSYLNFLLLSADLIIA